MTPIKQQILKQLPKSFDRQYVIKKFVNKGYSVSYADSCIEEFHHMGATQRIGRGRYKKLD